MLISSVRADGTSWDVLCCAPCSFHLSKTDCGLATFCHFLLHIVVWRPPECSDGLRDFARRKPEVYKVQMQRTWFPTTLLLQNMCVDFQALLYVRWLALGSHCLLWLLVFYFHSVQWKMLWLYKKEQRLCFVVSLKPSKWTAPGLKYKQKTHSEISLSLFLFFKRRHLSAEHQQKLRSAVLFCEVIESLGCKIRRGCKKAGWIRQRWT